MKKHIVFSGKKVIALLLLLVVLFSYMPASIVYGVSDVVNSEPEVEAILKSEENSDFVETEQFDDEQQNDLNSNESEVSTNDNDIFATEQNDLNDITENQNSNNENLIQENQDSILNQNEIQETENQYLKNPNQNSENINSNENDIASNNDAQKQENLTEDLENNQNINNINNQNDNETKEDNSENKNEINTNNETIENTENLNNEINSDEQLNEIEDELLDEEIIKKEINGSICWKDNNNSYGTRPASIKVGLIKNNDNSSINEIEIIPDEAGNWNYKFIDLPEKDEIGNEIKYTITVSDIEKYSIVIDENNNVTATLAQIEEGLSGNIIWKDNNNSYSTRPTEIIVNLLKESEIVSSITVLPDEVGNWNYKFENINKYDENGVLIDYKINANEIENYETIIDGFNIDRKLVGNTEITGNISWEDQENENNLRPENITVNIYKNNEIIIALGVTQNENGLWNYSVSELERYDENGVEIIYSVGINEIGNYKSTVEKISENEFNIKNVYVPKFEMDLTWQDILMNGPYISMNVEYAKEYGLELSQEEMYIYEKYQEMIYEKGPELAAIAMFAGTDEFTEEELAIYNAYQEIIINGGEKSPIALMGMMEDTGNAIKNNGTEILSYVTVNGEPVRNSIKYVAPINRNYPQDGDRVAYCVNYDRSYDNDATYSGTSWEHIDGTYGPVYLRLYSELSYLVTIGCKTYGGHNDSVYSTNGNWKEDYYATQTAIYNLIYDYTRTDNYSVLKSIVTSIKAEDPNGKLKNINPNSNKDLEKIAANIRATFTGHPGGNSMGINSSNSRSSDVKSAAIKLYDAVKNYRNILYNHDNADGYNASIVITNNPTLTYVQKPNGNSYYEATIEVATTGKTTSSVILSVPSGVTATRIGNSNNFKIKINKDKMATLNKIEITASARFDLSRTITYLSSVPGTQNVAFYQDSRARSELRTDNRNLNTVKTVQIDGLKTWKDNDNSYKTRPNSITINLMANGSEVETQTITSSNGWKWSFIGYPEKDNSGNKINYTITENEVSNYNTTISGYNVTNGLSGKTELQVTKNWKDNSNSYNTRPEKITINLLRNEVQVKTVELTSADQISNNIWKYTFKDLDKYDSNGKLYTYTITENSVKDYKTTIDGNVITNTLVGEIEFAGNKTWFDNNNAYSTRPDSILVELFANGAKLATQNVNEDNNGEWNFVFEKLAKYDNDGKLISYEIKEIQSIASDYVSKVNGRNLINTLVGKTNVSVKKAWNDDNNHHETRPEKITINLLADGVKVNSYDLTEADNWFYTFENLEKYTELGVKINYTITEEAIVEVPAGKYVTTIIEKDNSTEDNKQYEVTNCLTGKIIVKGSKIWKDNNNEYQTRPESITVNLYRENKNIEKTFVTSTIVTPDIEGNWKYEFLDLEKYDTKGVKYDYTVVEDEIIESEEGHYVDTYEKVSDNHTELVIDITNRLTGETELGGDKIWKDNNNAYGTRPDSIIVNLLANGEKVQDKEVNSGEKGDWKFLFANLIKFDEYGKKIEYTISENEIIDYVGKIEDTQITNTLTGKTEVTGVKIWHDSDNDYETRPESIIVKLLANGEEFKKKTVKADENGEWKFSFEDLDEYDEEGVKIVYTIDEVPVDRYITDIKGTTLINTLIHNHVDLATLTNLDITPKTGRKNLLTFFSISALISLIGLFIVNKKEENGI